jgi:hypothetical protein
MRHYDSHHNDIKHDSKQNATLSIKVKIVMLSVVMLNVANNPFMLSVVVLSCRLQMLDLAEKACTEQKTL